MTQTKHLYVHIPFCHSICSYCDFVRFVKNDEVVDTYTDKVIKEIKTKCRNHKFKTIYVGGGTPNSLNEKQLHALLGTLNKYLDKDYEFTIECNPEYLTIQQSHILKANKVNRASIGVQTVNNTLLRKFHRQHTLNDVKRAITNLRKVGINNISLDFIYGFNELSNGDVNNAIKFIKNARIPHVSWYALEIKSGSIIHKQNYKLNDEHVENQLKLVIKKMNNIHYQRYEVSNWCMNPKYQSQHNKAYWLTRDWKAIGLGSCGFEKLTYYENVGSLDKWHPKKTHYTKEDYYFQIMLMGLRLKEGLNLNDKIFKQAYQHYVNKLKHIHIKNNHLVVDDINLLDNTLLELM